MTVCHVALLASGEAIRLASAVAFGHFAPVELWVQVEDCSVAFAAAPAPGHCCESAKIGPVGGASAMLNAVSRLRPSGPRFVWPSTNLATGRTVPSMIAMNRVAVIRAQARSSSRRCLMVILRER